MERLEKIFRTEKEAKVALGLIRTLQAHNGSLSFFPLVPESLDAIANLIGQDYKEKRDADYTSILGSLRRGGFVKIRSDSTRQEKLTAQWVTDIIELTEEGNQFTNENYANQ